MKDRISLMLIFALALCIESDVWVWLPMLIAVAILQFDKIDKILK